MTAIYILRYRTRKFEHGKDRIRNIRKGEVTLRLYFVAVTPAEVVFTDSVDVSNNENADHHSKDSEEDQEA